MALHCGTTLNTTHSIGMRTKRWISRYRKKLIRPYLRNATAHHTYSKEDRTVLSTSRYRKELITRPYLHDPLAVGGPKAGGERGQDERQDPQGERISGRPAGGVPSLIPHPTPTPTTTGWFRPGGEQKRGEEHQEEGQHLAPGLALAAGEEQRQGGTGAATGRHARQGSQGEASKARNGIRGIPGEDCTARSAGRGRQAHEGMDPERQVHLLV